MKSDMNGAFVPAGIMIGLGVGFFVDQITGGLLIGLGAGFLMMAIAEAMTKTDKE